MSRRQGNKKELGKTGKHSSYFLTYEREMAKKQGVLRGQKMRIPLFVPAAGNVCYNKTVFLGH